MVLFNYSTKELTAKVVYYGPGLCGKTTNLQQVHHNLPDGVRGKMLSLATKTDRTLFFDFLPMDLGEIRGMKTRIQLYTVPGQVFYNETRKLVLKGADGIVFVADSQKEMLGANIESFKNLEENLKAHGMKLADTPHVLQFNKRDLPKLSSCEELNAAINKYNAPFYESVATTGIGVQDTLKAVTKLVLLHLTKKYESRGAAAESAAQAPPTVVPIPQPAPAVSKPAATVAASRASIPLSVSEPAIPTAAAKPSPVAASSTPLSQAADDEIEDLLGEVAEIGDGPTFDDSPAAAFGDSSAPPAIDLPPRDEPVGDELLSDEPLGDEPLGDESLNDEPPALLDDLGPAEERPPREESEPSGVRLTDVLSDGDLFDDPSLEVATVEPGESREIIVPVQLGQRGTSLGRFKLSIRLRLDPID